MNSQDLLTRAILVNLSIRAWSARKYDRKITDETNALHGATSDAGRYNKSLLPGDSSSYKTLTTFVSNLRVMHYAQTLPWSDSGRRLLPIANYTAYTDMMRKAQHEFDTLLNAFVREYPTLRDAAQAKLNGMFNLDDYPTNVRTRYSFSVDFDPVPTGTDFRVSLSQNEIDIIAQRTEERVQAAIFEAMNKEPDGSVCRLRKVVSAIVERLTTVDECSNCKSTGFAIETRKRPEQGQTVTCWICNGAGKTDATFRDSLITNARELCDVLTRLNVTDDPDLERLRCQTELLATTDPQTLRDSSDVREDTAKQAQSILDAITASFGKGDN